MFGGTLEKNISWEKRIDEALEFNNVEGENRRQWNTIIIWKKDE